jgi:hypothetical protein
MRKSVLISTLLLVACMQGNPSKPAEEKVSSDNQVMCTMDAMQCTDGSWVGRSGPNCEFVCPTTTGKQAAD